MVEGVNSTVIYLNIVRTFVNATMYPPPSTTTKTKRNFSVHTHTHTHTHKKQTYTPGKWTHMVVPV
jgi:hypothetical protein